MVELDVIRKLTNLNDLNRLLHETLAKERSIETELDKQLLKRGELERSILLLNAANAEPLELVHADSEQLLSSVQSTAQLAERISGKVRRLDLAQGRVKLTLERINLILERSSCIAGVQQAMAKQDYESAAHYIATFMDLERRLAPPTSPRGAAATAAVAPGALTPPPPPPLDEPQAEDQRQLLLEAKANLEALVRQQLDEAVAKRDHAAVVRFARLYRPLGLAQEGLTKFIDFLRLVVAGRARTEYEALSDQLEARKPVDFTAALTSLFKSLALAVEEHEALVGEAFGGREAGLALVAGLHAECDAQGTRLLRRYVEAKRLDRIVQEVSGRKGHAAATAATAGTATTTLDPRQVESHVQELVLMCQRSEEYCQFMLGKLRAAAAPEPLSPVRETAFRSGQFSVAVRELVGGYMSLEEYYMEESTAMAIRINEAYPDALTSSQVDDVFFILKKSATRALATASVQCSCALLAELNNLLANAYRAALQGALAGGAGRLAAAVAAATAGAGGAVMLGGASDVGGSAGTTASAGAAASAAASARSAAVALNDADVSADYILKLKSELEGHLPEVFPAGADRERVRSVLADLGKTSGDLRQLAGRATEQLADALMPRLRQVLDEVASVSYSLNEAEYAANELEDTWVNRLIATLESALPWLSSTLTTGNYESLLHCLLDKVVSRLEVLLGRKQFNQLGGLQLDRDTRTLVSHMSELTSRTVRDKFARLGQMATILGVESLEEFLDYWGDDAGHVTWRLTPAEARAVLAQRVDFSKEAIAALQM